MVKGGAKNVLFGGQGLFLLKLTGPGTYAFFCIGPHWVMLTCVV